MPNLDSSMEILASSTEDLASNVDTEADVVTAFDTDLPAEHNVSTHTKTICSHNTMA